ncbi:MAG TPA: penicillin acylase family protein, partial [Cyclobacteriaceae bacterium]
AMGRMAEVEGAKSLMSDLRMRLFIDTVKAEAIYQQSPDWMKQLLNAFADGANYYLATHPETKPKLITRFQPWMPLMFSEGSIGGDIESVSLKELAAFYDPENELAYNIIDEVKPYEKEPTGSNGFAIAPSKSKSGNALLWINPHTSFYFRPEVHMVSEEGLNAYGAVTWGQFFIYQGFNEHCGWMHTSSRADVIDEYAETIIREGEQFFYKYGEELKPLPPEKITLSYKEGDKLMSREYNVYHTVHGPVIANRDAKWISVKLMNEPLKALTQSFVRTKSDGLEAFNKTMEWYTNSSNNTVYADGDGNIAYYHGNFLPIRDTQFDWSEPVDGSNPATEWKGLHTLEESVHLFNPANGWIQNCNATPFTVSGDQSPKKENYPTYMAPDFENYRGVHAVRVLQDSTDFTLDKLIAAGYDSYLPAFEQVIPSLIAAYQKTKEKDLAEPMQLLKDWDYRYAEKSVPTTLSVYWAQVLRRTVEDRIPKRQSDLATMDFLAKKTSDAEKLEALRNAMDLLQTDFGTWKIAWGEINRFQRVTGDIVQPFDDSQPSIPIAYTSSYWGSLAAFGSRPYSGTKKWYGTRGNSFVAAVEFGDRIKAKSVLAGGVSGDPNSPHFIDQAEMYRNGEFKEVLFYREDIEKKAERTYHPGK